MAEQADPDDPARAASDAIGAWCAANPALTVANWFDPTAKRVEITYMSPTRFSDLADDEQEALLKAAEHLSRAYGGKVSVEEAVGVLFRALMDYGSAGATERR